MLRVTRHAAYNRNLCHVLNCCSYLNTVPQLKPKLNNAETKKPFHDFSFIKKAGAALVRTITSCLIVVIRVTPQVCLVKMYSKIISFTLRSVISNLVLSRFDFGNSISGLTHVICL